MNRKQYLAAVATAINAVDEEELLFTAISLTGNVYVTQEK